MCIYMGVRGNIRCWILGPKHLGKWIKEHLAWMAKAPEANGASALSVCVWGIST